MSIMLRTHRGWIELRYRGNKQLHRYLYSGQDLAGELKLESSRSPTIPRTLFL
ncbi:MAG: hypothetical protein RQ885_05720 [Desulfurococcales archaeon]|jgi:hypothetical protein|nr:hypothetical protein [Desulfurococcales archaeon]